MHFTCRSFIGKSPAFSWSQYWENEPDDFTLAAGKGHVFGLISISSSDHDDEIKQKGREIIDSLNRSYFSDSEISITAALKQSLTAVIQNYSSQFCLDIVIAVVCRNELYLATSGALRVIFQRQNKISQLLTSSSDSIATLSGPLKPEDRFLLVTDSFVNQIGWDRLKSTLIETKIQPLEENILSLLYSFDDQSRLAAALVQVHADEPLVETIDDSPQIISPLSANLSSDSLSPPEPLSSAPPSPSPHLDNPLSRLFAPKHIYVSPLEISAVNRRRKLNIVAAVLLLTGLALSSYFGYKKNQASETESRYQQYKTELDKNLANAFAVKNLNLTSAQGLARQSQEFLEKMVALKVHQSDVAKYRTQITTILSQTGAADSFKPADFYDTSLITDNPSYTRMYIKSSLLYLLDPVKGRIDSIDILLKNTKNISTNDRIKSAAGITDEGNDVYIYSSGEIDQVTKSAVDQKISLSTLSKAAAIAGLRSWNNALYMLDSQNNTIWKFTPSSGSFSSGQVWLKDNQAISGKPISLAINGSVWVLSENGQITPFSRGVKQDFKPALAPVAARASLLTVGVDTDYLAFVDSDSLIYVYKTNGDFIAKYNLDKLKINSLAVDDSSKSLFVLCSDQKIYKIAL